MRRGTLIAAACALPFAIAAVELPSTRAQDGGGANSETAQLFEKRCNSCHIVPDQRFDTDKAWISQILETS